MQAEEKKHQSNKDDRRSEDSSSMTCLVTEEGSSLAAAGSSTTWDETDLGLPEEMDSPDSNKFFQYIERLMTENDEERMMSTDELNILDMIDFSGSQQDIYKFYQLGEDDVNDDAGDGEEILQAIEKEAVDNPTEKAQRRRFFGIYQRVKVKSIWKRLTKPGVVRRSKKLRLMDLSATTSIELYYEPEVTKGTKPIIQL